MMWDIKGGERAFKIKKKKNIFFKIRCFFSLSRKNLLQLFPFKRLILLGNFHFYFFLRVVFVPILGHSGVRLWVDPNLVFNLG